MYFKKKEGRSGKKCILHREEKPKSATYYVLETSDVISNLKNFLAALILHCRASKRLSPPFRDIFEYTRDETLDSPINVEKKTRKIGGKTKEKSVYAALFSTLLLLDRKLKCIWTDGLQFCSRGKRRGEGVCSWSTSWSGSWFWKWFTCV